MCKECPIQSTIDLIDELVNDDDHRWTFAYDTLTGIKETIDRTGHVTPGQRTAVENIERAGKRRRQ